MLLAAFLIGFISGIVFRVAWVAFEDAADQERYRQCQRRMKHFDKRMDAAQTPEERQEILKRQTESICKIYGI